MQHNKIFVLKYHIFQGLFLIPYVSLQFVLFFTLYFLLYLVKYILFY